MSRPRLLEGRSREPLRSIARLAAQLLGPGPVRLKMVRVAQDLDREVPPKADRAA